MLLDIKLLNVVWNSLYPDLTTYSNWLGSYLDSKVETRFNLWYEDHQ